MFHEKHANFGEQIFNIRDVKIFSYITKNEELKSLFRFSDI